MSAVTAMENKLGGAAVEIAIKADDGRLIAVISHPCAGADWFTYHAYRHGRDRHKTRKAALAAWGLS